MPDHPVRLAVFDIDGTLINRQNPLGSSQIDALQALHQAGVVLALASSRQLASLRDLAERMAVPLYLIAFNGPLVAALDGTTIARTMIDIPSDLAAALSAFVAADGCVHVYTGEQWHAFGPDWRIDNEATGGGVVPDTRGQTLAPDQLPARALKILCDGPAETLAGVQAAVAASPGLVMSWSGTECHDIHAREASKGDGLRRLCTYLGIAPEESVAFGDADSDITMLEAAGTGYAMGDANARVRAAADCQLAAPGSGALEALLHEIAATPVAD